MVPDSAVLVAGDEILARREAGAELADITRDHHGLSVAPDDLESVDHVDRGQMNVIGVSAGTTSVPGIQVNIMPITVTWTFPPASTLTP